MEHTHTHKNSGKYTLAHRSFVDRVRQVGDTAAVTDFKRKRERETETETETDRDRQRQPGVVRSHQRIPHVRLTV